MSHGGEVKYQENGSLGMKCSHTNKVIDLKELRCTVAPAQTSAPIRNKQEVKKKKKDLFHICPSFRIKSDSHLKAKHAAAGL